MSGYTQLTREQRYQIEALLKAEHTQAEIADVLGCHKCTISREIARNTGLRGYRPKQAQRFCQQRRDAKVQPRVPTERWARVEQLLREDWSPEQISGWLRVNHGVTVSHEWIYQYVYNDKRQGGDLHKHLRCQKKRRKRYGSYDRRGELAGRVSIDERPQAVDERSRIGDWELDLIIGQAHQGALITATERVSRLTLIAKAASKEAKLVQTRIVGLLEPVRRRVKTMTSDNGREFSGHQAIAKQLKAKFFFAHPYASWQRGLNENTNGLIRQYLPKGTDFTCVDDAQAQAIADKLNNRPRKCLGFKTPNQVFFGINPPVALAS